MNDLISHIRSDMSRRYAQSAVRPASTTAPGFPRPGRGQPARTLASVGAMGLLLLLLVAPARAADPSPTPLVDFPTPQRIVTVDRVEWLGDDLEHNDFMLASPDDEVSPGNYDYVDATGGIFHFYGRDLAGPYGKRTDVCPFMAAHNLAVLGTGVWDETNPSVTAEECAAAGTASAAESPVPSGAPSGSSAPEAIAGVATSLGEGTGGGEDDPIAMEIAIALILLLLGIGGVKVLGVAFGLGPWVSGPPSPFDPGAPLDFSTVGQEPTTPQARTERPSRNH